MNADDYYLCGVAYAMSLVHEGPAPAFLSKQLFEALVGDVDRVEVPVSSLPDSDVKQQLMRVCECCPFTIIELLTKMFAR